MGRKIYMKMELTKGEREMSSDRRMGQEIDPRAALPSTLYSNTYT